MIPILYESNETEFISNGLGRLRDCIRCEVTEERNGIYECEFEYPVDGSHYSDITLGRIIAVEHDETGEVEPFDIYSYSRPINGVVTFNACHISYRQRAIVATMTGINSLSLALAGLKTAQPSNPFTYYSDMESTGFMGAADGVPRSVRELLGGVEGSILDTYGGEYEWNKFNVNLWRSRGESRDFTIRYGVNMTDFKDDTDYTNSYTAVIPYWVKDEVIVKGGMVSSGAIGFGDRESCIPLDLSDKFENQPTVVQLESAASSYMTSNQTYMPSRNIKVDFIRLQDSDEYHQFANLQKCRLCDSVKVIFPRYNTEGTFKIVKVVWDVLLERYIEMELGNLSVTLAEALGISSGSGSSTSATGTVVDGSASLPSSLSAGIDVTTQYGSIELTAGKWIINAHFGAQPSANSTGCYCIKFYSGSIASGNLIRQSRVLSNLNTRYYSSVDLTDIVELTSTTTIYAVLSSHYATPVSGKVLKAIRVS